MWGEHAVGKLMRGSDILSPRIEPFVDTEAGNEVAEKVRRRLGHFVDRRIAAAFEALIALRDDTAVTGLARGMAFRLAENLGVIPRSVVAADVKALDQEARGPLRQHGVRFGQFTIFQQMALKPAPTRLRLLLWALWEGMEEFPEAPPPGLVTIPTDRDAPRGYYARAGYRPAGERAVRIDMLERLADMLRKEDTRGGFEASPDMLSITGMTLDGFSDLLQGLGYSAERGERPKVKGPAEMPAKGAAAPTAAADANPASNGGSGNADPVKEASGKETDVPAGRVSDANPAEDAAAIKTSAEPSEDKPAAIEANAPEAATGAMTPPEDDGQSSGGTDNAIASAPALATAVETEVYYTFRWAPKKRPADQGQKDRPAKGRKGKSKPSHKGAAKAGGPNKGPRKGSAGPAKKEKPIDPDNPFAALAALKRT
ncbi:MAG: hypothetical protein AAF761_09725 [Pseudomonadota bacterium]